MIDFFNSNLKSKSQIVSATDEWLIDSDRKKIFDTWLGSGTLIFGHTHLKDDVGLEMLPEGLEIDVSFEGLLSELVDFEIGGIGFQTSGSSAITRAIRFARALTNRDRVAVVGSFWHGSENEFLFKNDKNQFSGGIPSDHQSQVTWFAAIGDFLDSTEKEQFAALLIEPHQGADPHVGMLDVSENQREVLRQNGVLLICDEIITGFRERYGSSDASRKAAPDIVVFGKAAALGFPIGIVIVDEKITSRDYKLPFWGGTFSASPTQLKRVKYSLEKLISLDYQTILNNHLALLSFIQPIAESYDYEIRSGCAFSRILKKAGSVEARGFLSGRTGFDELQKYLLAKGVYLGGNALVFPSVFNIYASMASNKR